MEPTDRENPDGLDERDTLPTADYGEAAVGPGAQIGPYKLVSVLGEGGYGTIYLAEQRRPVKRRVALKVIKPGMDSKQVLARFEAEQQALALMEHPHIARVYDAGLAPSGRSYFVMEHVKGLPITEHCDKYKLTIERRLQLFLHVCEAVQHAHQKGIIHRDLKPSNILVVVEDRETIPKVIDFGVARAISQPLTERTLHTEQGQLVGTPEYMSPEQANLTNEDIDTRTDVYSLGVVLYELLTGVLPFDPKTLRTGGIDHIRKVICEEDPKVPSTRLSKRSMEESTESARRRQTDVRTLQRKLHGDLDWITLKAMEKDRTRRYATVDALATDIRHHMNHQPVIAAPPGTLYRARKFARRHRQAMAAVGVATMLLLVFLWAARAHVQAGRERAYAEDLEHERILDEARDLFEARGMQTRGVSDASSGALAMIEPLLDSRHIGPKARLLRASILAEHRYFDEAEPILKRLIDEPPEIAGAAYALLARIIWESPSLGPEERKRVEEYQKKAEELLPETAEAYYLRAMMAFTIPDKFRLLDKALSLDSDHYPARRLRALTYQASRKYDHLRDDAFAMTILKARDPLGHSLRAIALRELADCDEAIKCFDRAIELTPPDDPQYIELNARCCETLIWMGQHEQAIADAQACLQAAPDSKILHFHIFCGLTALGKYEEANAVFQRVADPHHVGLGGPRDWSMKYVFDALEAGRTWHPADSTPEEPAFVPMLEAEQTHRNLRAKARRLIADCFTGRWSPDAQKLAFSLGFHGYSGVALYDPKSQETDLLIVPGKDPSWSPDGRQIAFVRDCEVLRLSEFTAAERKGQHRAYGDEEVWLMNADGSQPRRLASGAGWPSWSTDGRHVYYHSRRELMLCRISIEDRQAKPERIFPCSVVLPSVSPDGQRLGFPTDRSLRIVDLDSQETVTEWLAPLSLTGIWGGQWSPDGREFSVAGVNRVQDRTGLWIYDLDKKEAVKVLSGQITIGCWSPDRKQLLFHLGPPYYEMWIADLDPGRSTAEALGPGKTLEEHYWERIEACNGQLALDPNLLYSHCERAALALWMGDDRSSAYLQDFERAVDRVPRPARECYLYAEAFLRRTAFRDRLVPLIVLLARKAAEEEPGYARHFAYVLEHLGRQKEADHLWTLARPTANFLVNGGFEDGVLDPWILWGDATSDVVTQLVGATVPEAPAEGNFCLCVDVAPGALNVWDAFLRPVGVAFEAGKKYTVSAFLKARKGTLDITFKAELGEDPWTGFGEQIITITNTWAEYHATTPVFTEDVSPATVTFHLGDATGGFWIDNVRFYEGDYVPTVAGQ